MKIRMHEPNTSQVQPDQENLIAVDEKMKKRRRSKGRGQSMVELAMMLPLLVLLLSIIVEGGLAFNAWERVNTAARDATRFMLDRGASDQQVTLVLDKLQGIDFGVSDTITGSLNLDIWNVQGLTDGSGNIPNDLAHWKATQIYNGNTSSGDAMNITRIGIQSKLRSIGNAANITFVIVEVDFKYTPVLGSLIAPGAQLPMSNYAIIQQVPNN